MQPESQADSTPVPSEKVAPETLALRSRPRPVTRLNRRSLFILTGGLALAVLAATLWALQRPRPHDNGELAERYNVERVAKTEALSRLPADYTRLPTKPAEVVPVLGPPLPGDMGPPMIRAAKAATPSGPDAYESASQARLKEAEDAAASPVFFRRGSQSAPPPGFTSPSPAPTAADPMAEQGAVSGIRQDQKEAFLHGDMADTRNRGDLRLPASPYQVMAGTVIAGALVTGIRSDLPGPVIATVTEPVYDSATGHYLLIPQGSRLLGKYNSQVSYGQSRVQVVWNRIILPDTSSLTLDNLAGADPAGYIGLEDQVDWHWDRVIAGAAMTTLLGVGAELAAPENRQHGDRIILAGRDSLQDSVSQAGQELTRRNLDIQPTLTERPGLPVRIIVNRDLVLRPYQPLFFNQGSAR
ncbi:TrbI/VirB10 family protein [Dickeya fangzhongdai]|uniref:TrbI/VirB10 family protein n=1 Tax=Dickeya fangzhongdai TaxID=1778540 RepID=UPI0004F68BC5|nr:TrbI/VirB10 family protein [Dickeya fangzhongdai]AIR69187.1 conjugal transfer protein TrbI [Dickeya fangzhongdai]KGU00045.1 conjugal transfer protein TrbI [Dickeya fangzhongdai]